MNYTRTLKEYCLQNKGSLFNISEEYENHFKMMPKKKYYKILNRLEEEGYLHKESHGVYFIFDDLEKKKNNNRIILNFLLSRLDTLIFERIKIVNIIWIMILYLN